MYRIDIMTLFPDTVGDVLSESILGRAQERDFLRIETHQIRDYTTNKQNQVDDYPYGGGHGAILQADPLYRCWEHLCQQAEGKPHTVFLSPCGRTFTQADAKRLAWEHDHLILVCGHYEGVDQRFIDACVDEEISPVLPPGGVAWDGGAGGTAHRRPRRCGALAAEAVHRPHPGAPARPVR